MKNWNNWIPMPSPETCRTIDGPKDAGLYQIWNKKSNELVLFGIGKKCRTRMKSLYPQPYGPAGRSNYKKQNYILENWENLEYRTLETETRESALQIEKEIKSKNNHIFNT